MGLLENEYQRNISTESERKAKELKELKENAAKQIKAEVGADVDFTNDAKLMKEIQLRDMQKRIQQIRSGIEHRKYMKENSGEFVDGYTNPHEMAKKFASVEQMKSEINNKKNGEIPVNKTASRQGSLERSY